MVTREELAEQFEQQVLDDYRTAKDLGYDATVWIGMVGQYGAVDAAKRLIAQPGGELGFERLWELHRLDLSVEARMLRPEFAPLFTPRELAKARATLKQYEYVAPWDTDAKRTAH